MSRIKLKNIKMKAFRSFVDSQDSGELPESGVIGIFGKNLDTGGSNGSGKSNFHLAIPYAFGYSHIPSTELQSYLTEDKMQVSLTFEYNGDAYELNRGEVNSFTKNDETTIGAKTVKTKVGELLPISLDLLDALTFRPQRSFGRFMSMVDSDRKEFLGQLLNLNTIDQAIYDSKTSIEAKENGLEMTKARLAGSRQAIPVVQEPKLYDTETEGKKIEELDIQIQFLEAELSFLNTKAENCKAKINKIKEVKPVFVTPLVEETTKIDIKISELRAKDNRIKTEITEKRKKIEANIKKNELAIKNKFNFYIDLQSQIRFLNEHIHHLQNNTCKTCGQEWKAPDTLDSCIIQLKDVEAANLINTALRTELENTTFAESEGIIKEIQGLELELRNVHKRINLERDTAEYEFNQKNKEKIDALLTEISPILQEYKEKRLLYETLNMQLTESRVNVSYQNGVNQEKVKKYKNDLLAAENLQKQVTILEDSIIKISHELNLERDFSAMLKSFLNNIMEEVLLEIAQETNSKLAKLNNTSSIVVEFKTEKVTQKNTIKEEIRPILYKNGKEVSIRSGLSGGQFASVEWAVDLAINNVISRRTGFNPGWMVLDEPFHNHDPISRESCLELLKQEAEDKLIFIIEHSVETNELFDKKILIESRNDKSAVKSLI
jgi:DNA repair exonuclease SbcCD ATPase subunit